MAMVPMSQLEVGDDFIYKGKRYQKTSDLGYLLGVCNCMQLDDGHICHLYPKTLVAVV